MHLSMALKTYGLMTLAFLVIDLVWIGVVAKRFYERHLGFMLRPDVQWVPAILFYLLFIAGVLVFAVLPGLEKGSLARTVGLGAFLGLVAYATYDLTNLALTKGFPSVVAVVDMLWGTSIAAAIAAVGYGAARWLAA
jgi:uncharacterized membrane protein